HRLECRGDEGAQLRPLGSGLGAEHDRRALSRRGAPPTRGGRAPHAVAQPVLLRLAEEDHPAAEERRVSTLGRLPAEVPWRDLGDCIGGRRIRAGVVTSYTFDPAFFELHVLPLLFDQPFSQVEKVRRIQLADALRSVDHLAVYYDRGGLSQDAAPAQLDYR